MNARTALVAAALAACPLAGCRSDGGIDRQDNMRNLAWACGRCAKRTREDAAATKTLFTTLPQAVADSWTHGTTAMRSTYELYFENH